MEDEATGSTCVWAVAPGWALSAVVSLVLFGEGASRASCALLLTCLVIEAARTAREASFNTAGTHRRHARPVRAGDASGKARAVAIVASGTWVTLSCAFQVDPVADGPR